MNRSDINNRIQRFDEIRQAVGGIKEKGGLESVSESIHGYLAGAVPVGLDSKGTVVYPDSYDPQAGPAVLALKPGERAKFDLRDANELEAAEIARLYDSSSHDNRGDSPSFYTRNEDTLTHINVPIGPDAAVQLITYQRQSENASVFAMPRVLVVRDNKKVKGDDLGTLMAHEADHWDFYLNRAAKIQRDSKDGYTIKELVAIGEKEAFTTSRKVNEGIARSAAHTSLDQLHQRIKDKKPDSYRTTMRLLREYCRASGLKGELPMDIAVFAISTALGSKDVCLTPIEHKALQRLGAAAV